MILLIPGLVLPASVFYKKAKQDREANELLSPPVINILQLVMSKIPFSPDWISCQYLQPQSFLVGFKVISRFRANVKQV